MRLFDLAAKNDLYVIPTSWEYQDAVAEVADPGIRAQILGVPYRQRLMLLARQYDRLLIELKKRGLHKRIAQVELINELNSPPLVRPPVLRRRPSRSGYPKDACLRNRSSAGSRARSRPFPA